MGRSALRTPASTALSPSPDPALPPCIRAHTASRTGPASAGADADPGAWFYPRDQTTIGGLLDREIRSVLVGEVGQAEAEAWEGVGIV